MKRLERQTTLKDPKWKRFEKQIHEIHKQLIPLGAAITYDDKIMGFDSKTERQVEITIRYQLAGYKLLLVIDCKDYAQPVDVVDMGAFKSLAADVRANKAVMISVNGYTPAAIEMARSAGIETRTYIETESSEWRSNVSIPVLITGIKIDAWNVRFSSVPGYPFGIPAQMPQIPFPLIEVFATDGTPLGPILVLLGKSWHRNEELHVPGEHTTLLAEHVIIKSHGNDFHSRIEANLRVVQRHYFGPLGVRTEGFRDEQDGSITTKELATESIDPGRIERGEMPGWTEIPDENGLAVRVTFAMRYVDALPESIEEFHMMNSTKSRTEG